MNGIGVGFESTSGAGGDVGTDGDVGNTGAGPAVAGSFGDETGMAFQLCKNCYTSQIRKKKRKITSYQNNHRDKTRSMQSIDLSVVHKTITTATRAKRYYRLGKNGSNALERNKIFVRSEMRILCT